MVVRNNAERRDWSTGVFKCDCFFTNIFIPINGDYPYSQRAIEINRGKLKREVTFLIEYYFL